MYKMVNVNNPKLPLMTSSDLTTLFVELDNYKSKTPVIIDENKTIVAGHETAWAWAELKDFSLVQITPVQLLASGIDTDITY